jgi:acyl dehydratase
MVTRVGSETASQSPVRVVEAVNQFRHAENRIHDDGVARALGYGAGLVAGTTLHAYLTHPLVAAWGPAWLERGVAQVRFRRPVYEGDRVTIEVRPLAESGTPVAGERLVEVRARARGEVAATGCAAIAWGGPPVRLDPRAYPVAPAPTARPPVSVETLERLDPLGSPVLVLEAAALARYADEVADPLPLYRGPGAVAHPGLLLQQANRALSENVVLGPWVHVSSDLSHAGIARAGDRLTTRGRVARLSERGGHRYVELDLLMVAGEARPILHVRHVAIWAFGAGVDTVVSPKAK